MLLVVIILLWMVTVGHALLWLVTGIHFLVNIQGDVGFVRAMVTGIASVPIGVWSTINLYMRVQRCEVKYR